MSVAEADETLAEPVKGTRAIAAGSQLGRFVLRRKLGEGGMGVVWAAHDPDLDREIAIKLLRHEVQASDALRRRLLREARAMARLKHPNVITVYEVGTAGDTDFIAMELVEGATMDEWLQRSPTDGDVWRALLAAGRGLAAAHAAGLVHRDFKPHNVLRSNDGRVLVTDFGLARGMGEEPINVEATPVPLPKTAALDETIDATKATPANAAITPRTDSLHSPLTQTGAMIGTPAYMAPEQFHGAPPDPRTDQFAYCVSAWQALTGVRPFSGDTLEELRKAASAGVETVVANLTKPVRAVLARGLDPDPTKRWPSLEPLLEALEATHKPQRKVGWYVVGGVVVAAAIVFAIGRRDTTVVVKGPTCAPAESEFAEAWSDTSRADFAGKASNAAVERVSRGFEASRQKWSASWQEACNAPPSKAVDARLACLRGVRDEVVVLHHALKQADPRVLDRVDLPGMLPNVSMCSGAAPAAPPEIPKDQPRRDKSLAVLARALMLRALPDDQLPAAIDGLVAEAKATGWKFLPSIIEVTSGNLWLQRGDATRARRLFRSALKTANVRFQALAHLGMLEASVGELEKPGDGTAKPGAMHDELLRLLTYTRSAVKAAGSDPMLVGGLAGIEAEANADLGLWSRYRQPYKNALLLTADARREYERAGDLARAARIAVMEAEIYLARGNDRAFDDALYVVRSAEEAVAAAGLDRQELVDQMRGTIAFARGEYREAHDRFDRMPIEKSDPDDGVGMKGRVVDKAGNGMHATVVTWSGELHGDPVRVYTDARFVDGEVIETNPDGTFEFHRGHAIIAETDDARSAPRVPTNNITLVVEPTTSSHGSVEGSRFALVDAVARYTLGKATWFEHAAIVKDGTYRLDKLPKGNYTLGVIGAAGNGKRRVFGKPAWPTGQAIEIIVRVGREERDDTAMGWIFRGKVAPKTRGEIEELAAKATDVATTDFHRIGSDATEAGRDVYEPGDQHAIVINNAEGPVTICVALVDLGSAAAYCSEQTIKLDPDVNYEDGNYYPGVMPVLFKTTSSPSSSGSPASQ